MHDSSVVLCKSVHHGNTRTVAQSMAQILGATVSEPDHLDPTSRQSQRVLGIGSGIYYGRFHRSIRNWIASLPRDFGRGRPVFVYSTSGLPFLSRLYHWPIKRALKRHGFRVVGEFACRGHDTFGPLWLVGGLNRTHPDSNDLKRARAFALEMSSVTRNAETASLPLQQQVSTLISS